MNKLLIWLIATVICAVTYRLGGIGNPFRTWMRDWLIPPVAYGYLLTLIHPVSLIGWLVLAPVILLTGGALTTYWDKLSSDGEGNFWLHGFMVGIAAFPLIWMGVHWWMILARAIILAVFMGTWCKIFSNDWVEECGRGAIIAMTIPLLIF